jgi:hypothetical protein
MLEAAAELMNRRSEIERLAAGNGHVTPD